jgi:nitrate/nitrite transporter NarK
MECDLMASVGTAAEIAPKQSAAAEWRAHWPLTFAAMIGVSTIGLQSYGFSPFVTHVEREFDWSRSDAMLGVSVAMTVGIFLNIIVGMIVDRIGPRRVGLTGLFVMTGTFALLGTATGTLMNWSLLWMMLAVGVVLVQSTVWTSAVAARFDRSRGLALAVALSGAPLSAMILPVLATWLIGEYGWRTAFAGVGAIWLAVSLPVVFFFYRDGRSVRESQTARAAPPIIHQGFTLREGIRTRAFFGILVSFGAFSFYNMTISTNLVPLLSEAGASPMQAAQIFGVMGIVGIVTRISVGFLLDRFPGHLIGMVTQSLPIIGCALLMIDQPSTTMLLIAVTTFGLATGAEIDVALYLATRHFGLKAFAALFGAVITFGALNAAIGPYAAGWLHDLSGNYDTLLGSIMVIMAVGALGMASVGRPKHDWGGGGH